ncbi:hypothetical protein BDV95DRAFT_594774 [Massariosphaeria phaeospora]|uniref:Uncharacterized protein n=1 Tax=Massariosphaeria phaeospora TaxID=100035 RepID=A0A7C8I622_9PLEO|nr:hypothetical protein BDV95DRAFT_594774 [Massariosphaeria phaeospora]
MVSTEDIAAPVESGGDGTTEQALARRPAFPFLKLSAELRNTIYEFAAADAEEERLLLTRRCSRTADDQEKYRNSHTYLGFTQVNRLIRSEFRSMLLARMKLFILLADIEAWERTFNTDGNESNRVDNSLDDAICQYDIKILIRKELRKMRDGAAEQATLLALDVRCTDSEIRLGSCKKKGL